MTKDALWASIGPFSPMDTFSAYTMNAHHKRVSRRSGSVTAALVSDAVTRWRPALCTGCTYNVYLSIYSLVLI